MMTRRLLKFLLIFLLLGVLLLSLFGLWAVRSDGGRDFLMARIAEQLPEDSKLTWGKLEGTLWDGMAVNDLHYIDSKYVFTAKKIKLKNGIWPLLSRRLDIETLLIENAVLTLPSDDEPFELPRWPEFLPTIDLPMTIAVDQLQIQQLQIQNSKEKLVLVHQADAELT
ncbi:MAG: hypothetical protein ACRERV_18830, partial [Methylococcales bacterium]